MLPSGTRTLVKRISAVAVRRVVVAEHRQRPHDLACPGVSAGTRIIDCCGGGGLGVGLAHQ
jgi:hypothetical protein